MQCVYLSWQQNMSLSISFIDQVHNWINPSPNQRPRDPPSSVKNAVKDGGGKKTSVNVIVWSKVKSNWLVLYWWFPSETDAP